MFQYSLKECSAQNEPAEFSWLPRILGNTFPVVVLSCVMSPFGTFFVIHWMIAWEPSLQILWGGATSLFAVASTRVSVSQDPRESGSFRSLFPQTFSLDSEGRSPRLSGNSRSALWERSSFSSFVSLASEAGRDFNLLLFSSNVSKWKNKPKLSARSKIYFINSDCKPWYHCFPNFYNCTWHDRFMSKRV